MPPGPTYYLYLVECIELVDAAFVRATMSVGNPARPYDVADHLFFKLQSATPGALSESVEVVKKIVEKHGGDNFWPAKTQTEAEAIWTDRKIGFYYALAYAGEGAKAWPTDVWWVTSHRRGFSESFLTLSLPLCIWSSFSLGHWTVSQSPSFRNSCMRPSKTWNALASNIVLWAMQEMVKFLRSTTRETILDR